MTTWVLPLLRMMPQPWSFAPKGGLRGLQLAAFSLHRCNTPASRSNFIQNFAGDDRHIMDYLVEEIFNQQTEEVQSFLLRSSILDRLCGALCDAVVYEGELGNGP